MAFHDPKNHGTVVGRLGWEVRLEKVGTLEKCALMVACDRNYKDKTTGEYPTDWIRVDAVGENAKRAANLLKKGDLVILSYAIRSWTKVDGGKKKNFMGLDLVEFRKIPLGKAAAAAEKPAAAATPAPAAAASEEEPMEEVPF